jgi:hypothetical protein
LTKPGQLSRIVAKLRLQAKSDNWHRREEAGFTLRNLMEDHFDEVFSLTKDWAGDTSECVRRAMCLACMQRKAKTDPARVRKTLKRLTPLMSDDDIYVRKCCGPFVLGYLGYTYPEISLPWIKGQARRKDLNVRANVAKAFSQALGRRFPKEACTILLMLAKDERPRVRSAVGASVRNIAKSEQGKRLLRSRFASLAALASTRS